MTILKNPEDKSVKRLEKRALLVAAILAQEVEQATLADICSSKPKLLSLVLEAIEEASRAKDVVLPIEYLKLAEGYLLSPDNAAKREASRIVGNMAEHYPAHLDSAIKKLFYNTTEEGSVVRWASAYALSRIIILPNFAKSALYEKVLALCETEEDSGVRNQYVKALKKAERLRKS